MTFKQAMIAASFGVITAAGFGGSALAAAPVAGLVGAGQSSVAGCPYIEWRLARHPDGSVTGIAYYSDLSGTSQVTGNIDSDGKFNLKLTSAMGNGPTGDVVGQRAKNGSGQATLTGQGCANMHLVFHPVADIETYHYAGK